MQNIRQAKRKETSLSTNQSTSLHLSQIVKLIQQYQHTRMLYGINMSAGTVQSKLPEREAEECFDVLTDVPYITSEHYESKQTFADHEVSQMSEASEVAENFTDQEQSEEESLVKHRKVVLDVEDDFKEEDFQFVKHNNKESKGTFAYNSTVYTESNQIRQTFDDDLDLYRLQQTAHFSQAPEPSFDHRLSQNSSKQNQKNRLNRTTTVKIEKQTVNSEVSRKAMFLNKIQREKSRKEIVQEINKQRHHIKKFLK